MRYISKAKIDYNEQLDEKTDFILGDERNVLVFLTLKWHLSNRGYVTGRLRKKSFLLVVLDADDDVALRELNTVVFSHDMRMLVAFDFEDAGRIIETLHLLGPARASEICRGLGGSDDLDACIHDVLKTIRGVNTTDVGNLMKTFGSLRNLANAPIDELVKIPNIGDKKANAIFKAFNDPLSR